MKNNLSIIGLIILLLATILPKYSIFGIQIYDILTVIVAGILMYDGNKKRKIGNSFGTMNMFISLGLIIMLMERI